MLCSCQLTYVMAGFDEPPIFGRPNIAALEDLGPLANNNVVERRHRNGQYVQPDALDNSSTFYGSASRVLGHVATLSNELSYWLAHTHRQEQRIADLQAEVQQLQRQSTRQPEPPFKTTALTKLPDTDTRTCTAEPSGPCQLEMPSLVPPLELPASPLHHPNSPHNYADAAHLQPTTAAGPPAQSSSAMRQLYDLPPMPEAQLSDATPVPLSQQLLQHPIIKTNHNDMAHDTSQVYSGAKREDDLAYVSDQQRDEHDSGLQWHEFTDAATANGEHCDVANGSGAAVPSTMQTRQHRAHAVDLTALQHSNDILQQQVADMQSQLSEVQQHADALQRQLHDLEIQNQELHADKRALQRQVALLDLQVELQPQQTYELQQLVGRLQSENARLMADKFVLEADLLQARRELSDMQEMVPLLRAFRLQTSAAQDSKGRHVYDAHSPAHSYDTVETDGPSGVGAAAQWRQDVACQSDEAYVVSLASHGVDDHHLLGSQEAVAANGAPLHDALAAQSTQISAASSRGHLQDLPSPAASFTEFQTEGEDSSEGAADKQQFGSTAAHEPATSMTSKPVIAEHRSSAAVQEPVCAEPPRVATSKSVTEDSQAAHRSPSSSGTNILTPGIVPIYVSWHSVAPPESAGQPLHPQSEATRSASHSAQNCSMSEEPEHLPDAAPLRSHVDMHCQAPPMQPLHCMQPSGAPRPSHTQYQRSPQASSAASHPLNSSAPDGTQASPTSARPASAGIRRTSHDEKEPASRKSHSKAFTSSTDPHADQFERPHTSTTADTHPPDIGHHRSKAATAPFSLFGSRHSRANSQPGTPLGDHIAAGSSSSSSRPEGVKDHDSARDDSSTAFRSYTAFANGSSSEPRGPSSSRSESAKHHSSTAFGSNKFQADGSNSHPGRGLGRNSQPRGGTGGSSSSSNSSSGQSDSTRTHTSTPLRAQPMAATGPLGSSSCTPTSTYSSNHTARSHGSSSKYTQSSSSYTSNGYTYSSQSQSPPSSKATAHQPIATTDEEKAQRQFAVSQLPTLSSATPAKVLRQFLWQAGAEAECRAVLEKSELLSLAQQKVAAWEARRVLACEHLPQATRPQAVMHQASSPAALEQQWRGLKLLLHPDKHPTQDRALATRAFQIAQQAYSSLAGQK